MRAPDRDREQALALLRARCAQGSMSVDTFERNGTWLANRRVARALVVPGDEVWLGSCPVRLD